MANSDNEEGGHHCCGDRHPDLFVRVLRIDEMARRGAARSAVCHPARGRDLLAGRRSIAPLPGPGRTGAPPRESVGRGGPSPGEPGGRADLRVLASCGTDRVRRHDVFVHAALRLGAGRAALAPSGSVRDPCPLVVYALFSTALHVPLPRGWIEITLRDHGFSFIFR